MWHETPRPVGSVHGPKERLVFHHCGFIIGHTPRATTWVAQGSWLPIWIFRFYFCNIRTGRALPDISSCTLVPQKQPLGAGDISRRVGIDSNFHVQVDTLFAASHMHRKFSGRFLRGSCKWIWRVVSANLQHAHQRKFD